MKGMFVIEKKSKQKKTNTQKYSNSDHKSLITIIHQQSDSKVIQAIGIKISDAIVLNFLYFVQNSFSYFIRNIFIYHSLTFFASNIGSYNTICFKKIGV